MTTYIEWNIYGDELTYKCFSVEFVHTLEGIDEHGNDSKDCFVVIAKNAEQAISVGYHFFKRVFGSAVKTDRLDCVSSVTCKELSIFLLQAPYNDNQFDEFEKVTVK